MDLQNRLHHDLSRFRCRGESEVLFPWSGLNALPRIVSSLQQ